MHWFKALRIVLLNLTPMIRNRNRVFWAGGIVLWASTLVMGAEPKASIEVQVEVTEVDQSKAASLGVEWVSALKISENSPPGVVSVGAIERLTGIQADLHFLMEEGAAELLANPNLVTDAGSAATFHAGGEIPYITTAGLGTSNVEFKPYGVHLSIEPEVVPSGRIRMKIGASVSSPDQTNGVVLSGNTVPALLERKVTSQVTVEDGATMTLAGLVQTHQERTEQGVPLFRRIPLLGRLFRWKRDRFRRTTVIVFVTPRIINF